MTVCMYVYVFKYRYMVLEYKGYNGRNIGVKINGMGTKRGDTAEEK